MVKQYKYLDALIDEKRANGMYSFTTEGLHYQLDVSENALKKSLQRLKNKAKIAMVRRGFYVITPPEYSAKGIIPTSFYINELMRFLNRDYYVGLLNAASYHGAAHQQPQNYSIITEGIALRPIKREKVDIHFYIKKKWNKKDVEKKKVATGYIKISSPELTALDLISYYNVVGGFNRVATVIEELKEVMQPEKLIETVNEYGEISVVQRLGYVLECVLKDKELSAVLYSYLKSIRYYPIVLHPQKNNLKNMIIDNKWKVVPNVEIETDI